MEEMLYWWATAAAVAVAAELLTGTFYLLAVGAALAVGAVLAWMRATLPAQFGISAVACVLFVFLAHHWRVAKAHKATPALNLDLGARVSVEEWRPDGRARVSYRGSSWDAMLATPDTPRDGPLYITAIHGSTLVLSATAPSSP